MIQLKNKAILTRTGRGALWLTALMCLLLVNPVSAQDMGNEDCLMCHSDKDIEAETERGKTLNLFVGENVLVGSAHEGLSCTDCHQGAANFEEIPHAPQPLKITCEFCHEDIYTDFIAKDIHGLSHKAEHERAPYCSDCHGGHDILPLSSPDSRMSKTHQWETCGECHGSEELNLEDGITKRKLITRYHESVHFVAISQGKNGASCTDCHGHHNILSSAHADSTVSKTGILSVCQKCHPNETRTFKNGAHGKPLIRGNNDVPGCITCHGDHDMTSLRDRTGDAKQWASTQVCIWCHGNSRMMARYGLDTIPVESYMKDFHGLTQRGTMGASATCADCHDPHHSLPDDHPSSRMHISNRGTTCGTCHGQVTQNFALSFTHRKAMEEPGTKLQNIIRILYIFIIVFTVGGMLFYNFFVWLKAVRSKFKAQRKQKQIGRMSRFERGIHIVLIISFALLVLTGFVLKYPEAFWAKFLFSIGMSEPIRAFIHRFAALAMTTDLFLFASYMIWRRRGKRILKELLPRKRDFTEALTSLKYYLGITKEKPHYAIFNFAEKFEFWALVWGTVIMFLSGITLWFPKAIPATWPTWIIPVARTIHFYEAVLATLAIIIWHGFHVIFHPEEYPMNTSWITGYITEDEAKHRFDKEAIEAMRSDTTLTEE
jgi:cytochrome b subunit of formate dehydrogenase